MSACSLVRRATSFLRAFAFLRQELCRKRVSERTSIVVCELGQATERRRSYGYERWAIGNSPPLKLNSIDR
jgi:hypothetical protein